MERVLGIDLGTTNSVVSYFEQGQAVVIQNAEGSKTTPSVVYYKSPDEVLVGELAKRQAIIHPKLCIRSVKRFMGVRYSEIEDKLQGISYDIRQGPEDSIIIDLGWMRVTPEQVSAEILRKMRQTAEDYFGEVITKAVVTVPAYFNDNQRQATKKAGELAGLEIVRIINEPTAAALAYGVDKKTQQRIAVFDFGGGTFDLSVLEIDKDVFEVRSTRGDTYLGGDTIDFMLLEEINRDFIAKHGVDLTQDPQALQRLRDAVEKVKCELSSTQESVVSLPFISADENGPLHVNYPVSRAAFEDMISPITPRLTAICEEALRDGRIDVQEISNVLLVGGSTRIPLIQTVVREQFRREPNRSLNPDEAVAVGAAIQGSILTGGLREVLLLDVTPLSLGIELAGGVFGVLIPRNSSIPTAVTKSFTTVRDNQTVVKIHTLQGERRIAQENHSLGHFRLIGITPAPREIPAITVCFQIDANGILHVSASDATSGVSNAITIENYNFVTAQEADEIIKQAEAAVDEDRAFMRRKYVETQAEQLMRQLNKLITMQALPEEAIKLIRDTSLRLDMALSTESNDQVEEAFAKLTVLHEQHSADTLLEWEQGNSPL